MESRKNISDGISQAWQKLKPTCAEKVQKVLYQEYVVKMEENTDEFERLCTELARVSEELLLELSSLERELNV